MPPAADISHAANFLNLPAYRVTRIEEDEHDHRIYAEVVQPVLACIHCPSDLLVGFGRRERHIKDLPMHARRVGLYFDARRSQCRTCSKAFYEILPDVADGRDLTAGWPVGLDSKASCGRSCRSRTRPASTRTVRHIFRDYVNEMEAQVQFETPGSWASTKIILTEQRCVISSIGNNTLLDLLPNRNKEGGEMPRPDGTSRQGAGGCDGHVDRLRL